MIADRYRLEDVIATGGMGQIWRATDETLGRQVAVKVVRPETAGDPDFLDRFRAEARNSAALQHPNIVTVHDFGEGEDSAYLVMELIDGFSPCLPSFASEDTSSGRGHRDPPPDGTGPPGGAHDARVWASSTSSRRTSSFDSDGYARLADFGISPGHGWCSPLTLTGEVLGTAHYLSPEQVQGRPAGPASDIYALAVVGYEMLTGNRPFEGESMVTTALAHVSQPAPELPSNVPEPLRTTVMAGLGELPEHRPSSAAEFADSLRLPDGTVPEHLIPGAQSAVSPVIAGPA